MSNLYARVFNRNFILFYEFIQGRTALSMGSFNTKTAGFNPSAESLTIMKDVVIVTLLILDRFPDLS